MREADSEDAVDLVLSSGFLAFARHAGFLKAVEEARLPVAGVCGTSSGALVGALWVAGMPAAAIVAEVARYRPLQLMRLRPLPVGGLFSTARLVAFLERHLPPTFADLGRPFAVGVRGPDGRHALLSSGPLVPSVAASCAMPWVFAPVRVDGARYQDGGAVDRLGYAAWRALRGDVACVVHRIARTAGRDADDDLRDATVVETPRSGARFWSLGDVAGQAEEARRLAAAVLAGRSR